MLQLDNLPLLSVHFVTVHIKDIILLPVTRFHSTTENKDTSQLAKNFAYWRKKMPIKGT